MHLNTGLVQYSNSRKLSVFWIVRLNTWLYHRVTVWPLKNWSFRPNFKLLNLFQSSHFFVRYSSHELNNWPFNDQTCLEHSNCALFRFPLKNQFRLAQSLAFKWSGIWIPTVLDNKKCGGQLNPDFMCPILVSLLLCFFCFNQRSHAFAWSKTL